MNSELLQLTVTVVTIIFTSANPDSPDFRIFTAKAGSNRITCKGDAGNISSGDKLVLVGEYVTDRKYGKQFKIHFARPALPHTAGAMAEFLVRNIHGIGRVRASAIVAMFGNGVVDAFNEGPETIAKVPGISKKLAGRICAQFAIYSVSMEEQMFFIEIGVSAANINKLKKKYLERGEDAVAMISMNPYRLIDDLPGYGFKRADQAALKLGLSEDCAFRISAGFRYVLEQASYQGHTCLPKTELFRRTYAELELPEDIDLEHMLTQICAGGTELVWNRAAAWDEPVYLGRLWQAETDVAVYLSDSGAGFDIEPNASLYDDICAIEEELGRKLDESQLDAVVTAVSRPITVITGGPGVGKTTTVSVILSYMENYQNRDVMLAAPTGRAAKRMSEQTGRPAYTIHRLCSMFREIKENGSCYIGNGIPDRDRMPDTIVVDEASMIDINVMAMLLNALDRGTRLLFIGDVDQLPSVGPGTVLRDMIDSGLLPVSRLTKIHRQREGSRIVDYSHQINEGKPVFGNDFRNADDFFFVRRYAGSQIQTVQDIVHSIKAGIPNRLAIHPQDIQVLAPMKKGPLGVTALNNVLQAALNPEDRGKNEYRYTAGGTDFLLREGDKVIQTKNNYKLETLLDGHRSSGVFNGEGGVIRFIQYSESEGLELKVELDDGRVAEYDEDTAPELQLAYALTVHKSQGSEYKGVIIPLVSGGHPLLFNRNLLYTAVTRAKGMIMIFGDPAVLNRMIGNTECLTRYGHLKDMLQAGSVSV